VGASAPDEDALVSTTESSPESDDPELDDVEFVGEVAAVSEASSPPHAVIESASRIEAATGDRMES